MKTVLLHLAGFLLRLLCKASRGLWTRLEEHIRFTDTVLRMSADGIPAASGEGRMPTNEEKHTIIDGWLAKQPGFESLPTLRRRLIQAAVLWVRLETYWGELKTDTAEGVPTK